ncbi:MAG: helix-turn-helix transcriptional regulator [Clostridium sp.]|uniref:helix-turn-helix domain-containing protein n=1 Tax=Clostridium sp. TaxID=1506 RepID=UPI002FC7BAD9
MRKHGLSYLLDMLNISPSKMAQHLNVDRSLVSKWKSGVRKPDINNDYFDKLIDYLLSHNSSIGLYDLENLYINLYDLSYIDDETHLRRLTKKFIINNDIYSHYAEDESSAPSSYSIPVELYTGRDNRYMCIIKLLDFVEKQTNLCKLTFIYGQVLDYYMASKEFRTLFINRILALLNHGHKLDISYSKYEHSKFIIALNRILFHKNCRIFYNHLHLEYKPSISLHSIDNKLIVFSAFNKDTINNCDYSAVYKDPASISAYTTIINSVKANYQPIFNILTPENARNSKYGIKVYLESKQLFNYNISTYSHSPNPVIYSMDDELYHSVLTNSFSNENEIQKHYNQFKLNKESYIKYLENNKLIMFYPINLWTEQLKSADITYYEQPLIHFYQHRLTREQFRSHLHSLGDFLLKYDNLNICLVGEEYGYNKHHLYLWCRRNEVMCLSNATQSNNILISEDMSFVNSIYESLNNFHSLVPNQYKNRENVSNILKSL